MHALHPNFIVDHKDHKKAVIVPFAEWRRLMEAVEELEDIRAYDKAKLQRETAIPFEQAVRQIKGRAH